MPFARRAACTAALLAALALPGCATDRAMPDLFGTRAAVPPAEPPKPAAPPVDMAGRWLLASADGALCGMNFTAPSPASGTIAPEGSCPGNFFTSRKWTFDQGALVILDHKDQQLARLASSEPPGRFEGTAVSGLPVNLSR